MCNDQIGIVAELRHRVYRMNIWAIDGSETNIALKTKAHHNEEIVCYGINRYVLVSAQQYLLYEYVQIVSCIPPGQELGSSLAVWISALRCGRPIPDS